MKIKVFNSAMCGYFSFENRVNSFLERLENDETVTNYTIEFFSVRNDFVCVISYE